MARTMQLGGTKLPPVSRSIDDAPSPTAARLDFPAKITLFLLGLYILLKPYYLLPSGSPQVADILLVFEIAFLPFLPPAKHDFATRNLMYCMAVFSLYAALVNLGWSIALVDRSVAIYAAYYVFNLGLLIICLRIGAAHTKATLQVIAYAVVISAVIQAVMTAHSLNTAQYRQTASFNNPNQLGYWSLLSLCIFLSITIRVKIKWYMQAPAIICLCYAVALSLSKAAMIASALMLIVHFARSPRLVVIALVSALIGYLALENSTITGRVEGRLENIGSQTDDSLYSRGYLRVVEYPEYAVLGAGEGALYRFNDVAYSDQRFEIHSTFGTILFSYGVIGMVVFAGAIWQLYRASSIGYLLYLFPPFLYGLTHQGLRFSFLWLLISVIAILGRSARQQRSPISPRHNIRQLAAAKAGRLS